MFRFLEPYILSFISLFVAVDAIGNIPVFISLIEGLNKRQVRRIIFDSVITATLLAVLFMFIGKFILRLLGVSISDFQIAGGILLFVIATRLLLPGISKESFISENVKELGVFPLGTPLITGPAVLTTVLMIQDTYGMLPTFFSIILNMLFALITMIKSQGILNLIGKNGIKALAKITYILLAAIAVMMVRIGIFSIITE